MAEPPIKLVIEMQNSGLNDAEIIKRLREQGYSEKDINDSFNQAKVKSTINQEPFPTPVAGGNYSGSETPQPRASEEFIPAPSP